MGRIMGYLDVAAVFFRDEDDDDDDRMNKWWKLAGPKMDGWMDGRLRRSGLLWWWFRSSLRLEDRDGK